MERWQVAENRGMQVARLYEEAGRGATVLDVSGGDLSAQIREALGTAANGLRRASADLVSLTPTEVRVIEVKTRGGGAAGSLAVPERELETFRAGSDRSWLYLVQWVTQPAPVRMTTLQNPARLAWSPQRAAKRGPEQYRGVRHEGTYAVDWKEVLGAGIEVDLGQIELPSWGGASRD